ncbi:hypothetical protein C9I57_26285 [Trinickia symbiotica]|uniref:Uncharacterized protein n=1 Tax=Trinickia symbiotica TaxID=863227 RepID=A0A2T3XMR9_9BURK|nr:DUF6013 family protein [Trinickia symbiotica]PTB17822.1 hypothetical protein C9I57_26285 [Trinickia symbiotica]
MMRRPLRPTRSLLAACACAAACAGLAIAPAAHAAPPITVTSKTPTSGPIKYTVKVASKAFGNLQETRTISSGQTDDFNWKTASTAGATPVPEQCPGYSSLALDANGALARQISVRLAPIVADDGTATVQMSVQASMPKGRATTVKTGGKTLQCPQVTGMSQVVRFTMPTTGAAKTVALNDGTRVTVSAKR